MVVRIAAVVLYNSQVADPQWGSFASPSLLASSVSTFSKMFRTSISCVCSLATTYFVWSFPFLYLMFLLAFLNLSLLLPPVLPPFSPVSCVPLIS